MLIQPFIKVGNLLFSDNKTQIREKVNEKFEEGIKEFGQLKEYYDYFPISEFFVYYGESGSVNAFEFFKNNPEFRNVDLLGVNYKDLLKLMLEADNNLKIEYNGFTSFKYGIGGGTNDDPENDGSMPESVIVFKEGYYN